MKHFVPRIESLLKGKLGAEGTGLIEQMNSIRHVLPDDLQDAIRQIGRTRNKVFHEHGFEIVDRAMFASQCQDALDELEMLASEEDIEEEKERSSTHIDAYSFFLLMALAITPFSFIAMMIFISGEYNHREKYQQEAITILILVILANIFSFFAAWMFKTSKEEKQATINAEEEEENTDEAPHEA